MTPDGRTIDKTLPCGGIPGPAAICWPDPLPLEARDLSGYWDVPCAGPGPAQGCATPVVPDAVALAQARPLRIAALDVPVGPVGHRELEIGRAVLPNGILSKATFAVADEAQRGFVIDPIVIQLVVRSTDSARPPFTGLYQRGRFPGVEEVRVLFAFDVVETSPGAVIHVRDVDVH